MSRVGAVFFAFLAVAALPTADVAVAASAEQAIKNWIATVPSADWKISYRSLAYDAPTDRTTVTGLTATSASLELTVAFTTVAITGYTPTPDGGFNAAALTADGGTITSDEAKLTVTGVTASNFGTAPMTAIAYDKDRPISSLVQLYANLLKIHLDHAGIASLGFKDESDDSAFSYSGLAIDQWANDKVGRMTMGPMEAHATDDDGEPVRFSVGGFETRDIDLDAIVRVYDPSRYAGGVGDQVWRPAIASARYHDFVIESSEFDLTMGAWTLENLKMRQPRQSFTAALDKAAAAGKGDAGPEVTRAAFDIWSSFALGKLTVSDVSLDANSGFGTLGAFTLADISSDGIGEISIDALDASYPSGFVAIGRLAAGGIVFPGVDKLFAAYEAGLRQEDVDFTQLAAKLGYLEAADIDVEAEGLAEMALEKFRLDLSNYIGMVPTSVAVDLVGFDAAVSLFSTDDADVMLKALGYDRLHADYRMMLAWREADESVAIDDFRLALADIGNVSGRAVLGGLSRKTLGEITSLPRALADLTLVSSSLTIEDKSLLNRWIAQQAYDAGVDQAEFRKELAGKTVTELVADLGGSVAFRDKLADALRTYILRPGSLTVTAKPPDPVPVSGLALFAALFPDTIPEILGLDVNAVAGPEPVPFKYVPPKAVADDQRHVPFKKY